VNTTGTPAKTAPFASLTVAVTVWRVDSAPSPALMSSASTGYSSTPVEVVFGVVNRTVETSLVAVHVTVGAVIVPQPVTVIVSTEEEVPE